MTSRIRTTAVFLQPFELASFDEVLPAGDYEIETELLDPVDGIEPGNWTASVLVHLKPRTSHPGLARTLTVPLTELEDAIAIDKLSGKALTDYFLDEMLADPMICLVMQADGVSEEEIRRLYAGGAGTNSDHSTALHEPRHVAKADVDDERSHLSDRHVRGSANEYRASIARASGHEPVTDYPIDFDCGRTVIDKLGSELFRNVANWDAAPGTGPNSEVDGVPSSQLTRKRRETMERAVFLLSACAATREGGDPGIQKLIMRAESDLALLRKREETLP